MASRKQEKASARDKLRAEQERRRAATRRNRLIGVTAAVVALVVLVVAIGIVFQQRRAAEAIGAKGPSGTVAGGLAIPVGKPAAKVTLTVYEDFRCPVCKQFEDAYGKTIDQLVASGELKVEYHVATIIDSHGGGGSKRSANAAACAQQAGRFGPYHDTLYANQPPETDDAFTNDRLVQLAGKVKGLGGNAAFESCVKDDRYGPWVQRVQGAFDKYAGGAPSTPTLLLNGRSMRDDKDLAAKTSTPQKFAAEVHRLAR